MNSIGKELSVLHAYNKDWLSIYYEQTLIYIFVDFVSAYMYIFSLYQIDKSISNFVPYLLYVAHFECMFVQMCVNVTVYSAAACLALYSHKGSQQGHDRFESLNIKRHDVGLCN